MFPPPSPLSAMLSPLLPCPGSSVFFLGRVAFNIEDGGERGAITWSTAIRQNNLDCEYSSYRLRQPTPSKGFFNYFQSVTVKWKTSFDVAAQMNVDQLALTCVTYGGEAEPLPRLARRGPSLKSAVKACDVAMGWKRAAWGGQSFS